VSNVRGNPRLKFLDRAVGIPAVRLLALMPKRTMPAEVRSIGVLRTAAIGDTLLLRGALQDIRDQRPQVRVVLITGRTNAQAGAFVSSGLAEHFVVSERNPAAALRIIRPLKLDLLIDTGSWPRLDAILTTLSGASFRVGFKSQGQARHYAYDLIVEHSAQRHEADNFGALLKAIGLEHRSAPSLTGVELPVNVATGDPYLVFHPWSGGYKGFMKEWPAERWIELGRELGTRIIVTGSPAEAPRTDALVSRMKAGGIDAVSLTNITLAQVASVLKGSRAVVSVNTGVMHLAAMIGAPTVCLDGPTPPLRWGPIGPRVTSVSSSLPGCGYLHLGFEYDGHRSDCMLGIDVPRVISAVRSLIN
jgi:heptosyltransferase III